MFEAGGDAVWIQDRGALNLGLVGRGPDMVHWLLEGCVPASDTQGDSHSLLRYAFKPH